jgi:hypothetical protein
MMQQHKIQLAWTQIRHPTQTLRTYLDRDPLFVCVYMNIKNTILEGTVEITRRQQESQIPIEIYKVLRYL